MQRTDHLVIGKIVPHHGVRGEVKIYPFTDDVSKFLSFGHLFIVSESDFNGKRDGECQEEMQLEISSCRIHKNMPLILFGGIDSIEKGSSLIGRYVAAEREFLDDGEGGHFVVDLIGLHVVSDSGDGLGVILDVLQNTAQDVYEIRHPSGKVFFVPVVDEFVREISVEEGYVRLRLPDGLLELYGISPL